MRHLSLENVYILMQNISLKVFSVPPLQSYLLTNGYYTLSQSTQVGQIEANQEKIGSALKEFQRYVPKRNFIVDIYSGHVVHKPSI